MDSLTLINVTHVSIRREKQSNQVCLLIKRPGQPDFFIVLGKAGKEPIRVEIDDALTHLLDPESY